MQSFLCPICGAELRVVDGYLRALRIISFVLAWLLPFALGARNVLVIFIVSVPLYGTIFALLVYLAKHLIPPDVVSWSRGDGSVLGLRDSGGSDRK